MDQNFLDLSYLTSQVSSIVATDEVGRGCLAGPVTVCSVLAENVSNEMLDALKNIGITDSKKISVKKRGKIIEALGLIRKDLALGGEISFELKGHVFRAFISHVAEEVIDSVNILQATFKGMNESASAFLSPNILWLIDGNQKPKNEHPLIETLVQGDSKSLLIGLASIIAKEARDQMMEELDANFPGYGWKGNAGYGTKEHLLGIKALGPTKHHRKSFAYDLSKL